MSPILDECSLDLISHSEAQTRRFGARLGELVQGGDVICLAGELGSGKTRFVQGVGLGLGVEETITSPTFTLVNEYKTARESLILHHIDLYRVQGPEDTWTFGLEDYLYGEGVCLIEWADRVPQVLPGERLWIALRHIGETKRGVLMKASGERYEELLHQFKRRAFRL